MSLVWEWREGAWVEGHSEYDCQACCIFTTEPSPETGHVGWVWWALGRMGDAPTLPLAQAAAEAVLSSQVRGVE